MTSQSRRRTEAADVSSPTLPPLLLFSAFALASCRCEACRVNGLASPSVDCRRNGLASGTTPLAPLSPPLPPFMLAAVLISAVDAETTASAAAADSTPEKEKKDGVRAGAGGEASGATSAPSSGDNEDEDEDDDDEEDGGSGSSEARATSSALRFGAPYAPSAAGSISADMAAAAIVEPRRCENGSTAWCAIEVERSVMPKSPDRYLRAEERGKTTRRRERTKKAREEKESENEIEGDIKIKRNREIEIER